MKPTGEKAMLMIEGAIKLMPDKQQHYEIILRGHIDPHWVRWFEEMEITSLPGDQTRLTGSVVDAAALNGLLSKIRDLGYAIVYLKCEDNPTEPPQKG